MARDLTATDWLTGNPVHIGWYDVRWTGGSIQRRWWDGAKWLCSPDGDESFCGESYGDTFRGLTAPYAGWKRVMESLRIGESVVKETDKQGRTTWRVVAG